MTIGHKSKFEKWKEYILGGFLGVVMLGGLIAIIWQGFSGTLFKNDTSDSFNQQCENESRDRSRQLKLKWKKEDAEQAASESRIKDESDKFLEYLKENNLDVVTGCQVDGHNLKINIDNLFFTKPYQIKLQVVQSFFIVFVKYKNASPDICNLTICDPLGNEVGGCKTSKENAWVKKD